MPCLEQRINLKTLQMSYITKGEAEAFCMMRLAAEHSLY